MRLSRWSSLSLLVFSVACTQNTEPRHVSATYSLHDIDGRMLPTPPAFTPGLTATVLSSILTLEPSGSAAFTDHQTEWNGVDDTVTYRYTYTITGFKITFVQLPCPANAYCFESLPEITGTIIGDNVTVARGRVNTTQILYHYHPQS